MRSLARYLVPALALVVGATIAWQAHADGPIWHSTRQARMTVHGFDGQAVNLEVCALRRVRPGINAALELSDGRRLSPSGEAFWLSDFSATVAQVAASNGGYIPAGRCIQGYLGFDVPSGARAVAFIAQGTTPEMRWAL
jgi:hypothetical protein